MEFFKKLSETNIKNIVLDVHFDNGIATVCVIPKTNANDKAINALKPLFVTKEIDTIDTIFFDRIFTPIENTQIEFDNVVAYETKLKEQTKRTAEKKELQNKIEKHIEKLKKIMEIKVLDEDKKSDAAKIIKNILELDPKNKYALQSQNTISQGGLF